MVTFHPAQGNYNPENTTKTIYTHKGITYGTARTNRAIPGVPLPTDYWTRPINPMNREWYTIAGNWLSDGTDNHYTKGPESAHIVWTKELFTGGIVGGDTDKSYYTGSSYERKWSPPVIIQGRLYYNQPLSDKTYQSRDLTVMDGQKLVCVDLRTGEELWRKMVLQ